MKTRKMTDRMLLEGLVNKYGAKRLTNVINEISDDFMYLEAPDELYYGKLTRSMIKEWTAQDPDLWYFIKLHCLNDDGTMNIYQITDTYEDGLRKMTPKQMNAYIDEMEGSHDIRRRLPENVTGAYETNNGYFCFDCKDDDYTVYSLTNIPFDKFR